MFVHTIVKQIPELFNLAKLKFYTLSSNNSPFPFPQCLINHLLLSAPISLVRGTLYEWNHNNLFVTGSFH